MPCVVIVQTNVFGLQHAPWTSAWQACGLHGTLPVHVPPLKMQSQLDARMQLLFRQQAPKTGPDGQTFGEHG